MTPPQITIGILNLNGLGRLRRCLPSVLGLRYPAKEVLVVDYGSTDGSVEYLRQLPGVRIVGLEGGFHGSRGRNRIIEEAAGTHVLMLDNDIEIPEPDLLTDLYLRSCANADVAFLSPLVLDAESEELNEIGLSLVRVQRRQPVSRARNHGLVDVCGYYGNCVLFRKAILDELGGFDEVYAVHHNDYDLGARAHLHGYRVSIDTDHTVIHHGAAARVQLASVTWRYRFYLSSMLRIACKTYRSENLLLWWPIITAWIFVKALRLSWINRSARPLGSCFASLGFFLRDLPDTLRARRHVQAARRVPEDRFLQLRPPVF